MKDICKVFDNYLSNYDLNNKDIKRKYDHSYRVMKLSEKYAKKLGYDEHDVKLATLIGLFHDIGRFEQLKIYGTYDDRKSIDHANYGCKVLFEDGLIKELWDDVDDYEIIKFAIENHNKFKIESVDNEKALMHAKLIRDTDKLDIVYLEGFLDEYDVRSTKEDITPLVKEKTLNHEEILHEQKKNKNDSIATTFAFAFDINNDIVLEELKQNYKYFYEVMDVNNKFEEIYNEVIKYIDERIDKYARN